MKTKVFLGIQIIVGVLLVIFGLNKFLHFMPNPQVLPEMGEYMGALYKTGYMMALVGTVQLLSGLAFILNKYVALMAIVIVPVMLNAVLAHVFLDPAGVVASAVILLLIIAVMFKNKASYVSVLKA